jgi:hypothetical protein
VLDHPSASRGCGDRAHGRNVDGLGAVTAGAHEIHRPAWYRNRRGVIEHRLGQPGDLAGGLALDPECHAEARNLGRRRGALHDLVHRPRGLLSAERFTLDERADQGGPA